MKTWFSTRRQAALPVLLACLTLPALAGQVQLVSVPDPGQTPPAGGGGDSVTPIITPDGRYVLFASTANNLVLNSSTNPIPAVAPPRFNVFLRDRTNSTTVLVSVNLSGLGGGNGDSLPAGVSTNGRYALFESSASNLVPGDTNNATDLFLRDLVSATTLLVSVSTNGGVGNGASRSSVLTPDGRYVAFVSAASNLVPGDTNGIADVFVRDLQGGVTTLASVGTPSAGAYFWPISSDAPDITPDGRYIAFLNKGVSNSTYTVGRIYVRDLVAGTTVNASSGAETLLQAVMRMSFNHTISADGNFVAYEASPIPGSNPPTNGVILRYNMQSGFTDLVSSNANVPTIAYEEVRSLDMTPDGRFIAFVANTNATSGSNTCIYLWDGQTGQATLASGDLSNGVPANSMCDWPFLDPSGRFVAFLSSATNLVTNSLAGSYHIYVRDMQASTTTLVDADSNGVGAIVSPAAVPRWSANGRFVAFECADGNLVPGDGNHADDVFVRDLAMSTTELISVRESALPTLTPDGTSILSTLSVSTNGRYIAFSSDADNLVANDTNGLRDVFVRDLLTGTNILVSVATNGFPGDGASSDPVISADGRYVAFTSRADNLVPGDTNNAPDVFVRDVQAGTTMLVSVSTNGLAPGNAPSFSPMISADGSYVVFHSTSVNLTSNVLTYAYENLFLRGLQAGTTFLLSVAGVSGASMTPDGRFAAFTGAFGASPSPVYVWDSQSATRIYTNSSISAYYMTISPDGRWIVYAALGHLYALDWAANTNLVIASLSTLSHGPPRFSADSRFLVYPTAAALIPADTNAVSDVYLYDFQTGTNFLVSQNCTDFGGANGASDSPDISPDGRFVAYRSFASNIVPGDSNNVPDVFVYDQLSGTTTLLSASRFGSSAADNCSFTPVFSGDGQTLIFQSWASDLVANDFNQNGDIFAFNLYSSAPIPLFYASILPGATPTQGPRLSWPAAPGKTYRVQFKNDLGDPAWQNLNGNVTIVGGQGYLNDLPPASGQRFYRIVAF